MTVNVDISSAPVVNLEVLNILEEMDINFRRFCAPVLSWSTDLQHYPASTEMQAKLGKVCGGPSYLFVKLSSPPDGYTKPEHERSSQTISSMLESESTLDQASMHARSCSA
jgi:hypothetical protein